MNWAGQELENVDLGNKRLEIRVIKLLKKLGEKSTETIPVACQGWAEIKSAYRFFDNAKVTAEKILASHVEATLKRMKGQKTILFIHDTTQLNYSTQFLKKDIGQINNHNN